MTMGMSVALKMQCCLAGHVPPNACSRDMLLKRLIGAALVLTLILPVAPVLASDTFHALSRLPATAQASLTPLDEAQLAAIEGGLVGVGQANTSTVTATQSNAFSIAGSSIGGDVNVTQSNSSTVTVSQANTANGP
jgi:hypothetical protein